MARFRFLLTISFTLIVACNPVPTPSTKPETPTLTPSITATQTPTVTATHTPVPSPTPTPLPNILPGDWATDIQTGKVIPEVVFPLVGAINKKHHHLIDLSYNGLQIAVVVNEDVTQISSEEYREYKIKLAAEIDDNAELKSQFNQVKALLDQGSLDKYSVVVEGGKIKWVVNQIGFIASYHDFENGELRQLTKEEEPQLLPGLRVNGSKIERVDKLGEFIQFKGVNILNFDFPPYTQDLSPTFEDTKIFLDEARRWGSNLLRLQIDITTALSHRDELEKVISYAEQKGMYVILSPTSITALSKDMVFDPRETAVMDGIKSGMEHLAEEFSSENNVLYGLLNEAGLWPKGQVTWENWSPVAQNFALAIRAINKNAVLVLSGIDYSRNFSGLTEENFPFDNFICDVHYYGILADHNGSDLTERLYPSSQWKWLIGKKPILIGEAGDPINGNSKSLHATYIQKAIKITSEHPQEVHYTGFALQRSGDWNLIKINGNTIIPDQNSGVYYFDDMINVNSPSPIYDFTN